MAIQKINIQQPDTLFTHCNLLHRNTLQDQAAVRHKKEHIGVMDCWKFRVDFRVDVMFIGDDPLKIKWSAPQPAVQADTPTYQKRIVPNKNDVNPVNSGFLKIHNAFLFISIVLFLVANSCYHFCLKKGF